MPLNDNNKEDTGTRDVSHCERLILLIEIANHLHENGKLADNMDQVKWSEIDRLKALCDVLPGKYQTMLATVEAYRKK